MILATGWKNVWRNKTRSLVVIVAVMLGIFGGVMATGIMQGWIAQRIHDCIYKEVSHVQIHNPQYMYNEELQLTIRDFANVSQVLDTAADVVAWSPRVKMQVVAKRAGATTGFILQGVDPEREEKVSEIHNSLITGSFLEGKHREPSIVVGSKTAENLKLVNYKLTKEKIDNLDTHVYPPEIKDKLEQLGSKIYRKEKEFHKALATVFNSTEQKKYADRLVKYFSFYRLGSSVELIIQDKKGQLTYPVFKIRGIYKTDNSMYDGMNAFVDRSILNQYTGLDSTEVHEIAIISTDNETGAKLADRLSKYLPGQDILSWRKLSPEIALYTDFSHVIGLVYVVIILLALAFGIINTMLMSVLERVKELGMLMAIGMNKKRVFSMIMVESVFLTLTGAVLGMAFCGILMSIFSRTGINFSMWSEGFEAIGYAAIVYPFVTWDNYVAITIMVILTGIISSIWPARKALRLNPVEALRTE
jgi:ABC-type lipoprotein release transport system permease subunit